MDRNSWFYISACALSQRGMVYKKPARLPLAADCNFKAVSFLSSIPAATFSRLLYSSNRELTASDGEVGGSCDRQFARRPPTLLVAFVCEERSEC